MKDVSSYRNVFLGDLIFRRNSLSAELYIRYMRVKDVGSYRIVFFGRSHLLEKQLKRFTLYKVHESERRQR